MNLLELHRGLLEEAGESGLRSRHPVTPKAPKVPLIASERWMEIRGALSKSFRFRRLDDRNDFIVRLLSAEASHQHGAVINIDGDVVSLRVQTKHIEVVSELDREFARYADLLFKELVYRARDDGDES